MKKIILAALLAMASAAASATPQERCALLGDSIQALVYEQSGVVRQSRLLTANRVPQQVNVQIQNLSSPGMTMAQNGTGTSAYDNRAVLRMIDGVFGAKCLVITLGTNDWNNPSITTDAFQQQYKAVVQQARSLGMQVVCVSPIWRADQDQYKASGTESYQLWVYRWVVEVACTNGGGIYIDGAQAPLLPEHFADGLHMNAEGHRVFTNWLIGQMQQRGFWTTSY